MVIHHLNGRRGGGGLCVGKSTFHKNGGKDPSANYTKRQLMANPDLSMG